jgi:hypothetical protein
LERQTVNLPVLPGWLRIGLLVLGVLIGFPIYVRVFVWIVGGCVEFGAVR